MPTSDALLARALDALVAGDTEGGITDLEAHLQARPDDAAAWLALGTAHAALDRAALAASALDRAVTLDPTSPEARLAYARALARLGRLDAAAAQLEAAARLDPGDARVRRELGLVRYDQRRHDEAVAQLEATVRLDPGDARTHYALGVVHEARRDLGAAVTAYRAATRCDPAFTDARRTLADALAGLGEHEAALGEIEAVLAIDPGDTQAAHNRAVLRRALAELRRARLLGQPEAALAASALVMHGGLRRKPQAEATTVRWAAPLAEVQATLDETRAIASLRLVLPDPARAAQADGDAFRVTVVAADGRRVPADLGTAITLTFLREALGCPLTQASAIYARLLGGAPHASWGDAIAVIDAGPPFAIRVQPGT